MRNEEILRRLENIRRTLPHGTKEAIEADEAILLAIDAVEERESLATTVNEAAELLRKINPRGDCRERLKEAFREASETGGDLFHLSQIERIVDGEDWL